ncbi:MAG: tRNA lysidine(34) synthetase TilS [Lentisphaerae bacterium]|nr:tRNA lysidine(34) synthetase TilS [Lentisphaerota bacterium]
MKTKKLEQIPLFLEFYRHKKLRIGFSGGADSTALLLKLLQWGFLPEQLEAVHFDHGLRGAASCADACWCRDFCKKLHIPFTLVVLEPSEYHLTGSSLEAAARNARLTWYRQNDDGSPVVLAHHANDRVETMLLKIARGGNSSALSSLRKVRKLWNLTILRPLLDYQKSELEDFLRQQNVTDWRIDSSNSSCDFHRNYLRNQLLKNWSKQYPQISDGLLQAASSLEQDADFIEQCAAARLTELGLPLPEKTSRSFWAELHPALRVRVLRSYLAQMLHNEDLQLAQSQILHFEQALQLQESPEKRRIELSEKCCFVLRNNIYQLLLETPEALPEHQIWHWQQQAVTTFGAWQLTAQLLPGAKNESGSGCFYFDSNTFPAALQLHFRRGGETMTVWGSKTRRRVKHLLSGVENKDRIVLVSDLQNNIYLLGNLRRSALLPVTVATQQTVKIKITPIF